MGSQVPQGHGRPLSFLYIYPEFGDRREEKKMAAPRDLRVTTLRSSILRPPENVERRLIFLSNIDQLLDFNVETIHFFLPSPEFSPDAAAKRVESAMEELLASSYDFLAGRLRWNDSEERWELDCNGAGAGFVEAASELTLAELGDLELPNPALNQLAAGKAEAMDVEDRPLFVLRVTTLFLYRYHRILQYRCLNTVFFRCS